MPLSWNEIKLRALKFSRSWSGAQRELSEYATFWDEFFEVFGKSRRTVAVLQEPVKKINDKYGFIDLFWPTQLLVEHKSRGKDLSEAQSQAFNYIRDLQNEHRDAEVPRYVVVTDFERLRFFDLEPEDGELFRNGQPRYTELEFPLKDLHDHVRCFGFIAGYEQYNPKKEDPINIRAAELLDNLHTELDANGYRGHDLEVLLIRVLFCMFAEDTGIFEKDSFKRGVKDRTNSDGSDLGPWLSRLFEVLDTPREKRQSNLDADLARFPYVNGGLFRDKLNFADFNSEMRSELLKCADFDWGKISPAVFGSLFQGVMDSKQRRETGAHYTSERDILRLIGPLFMDELREEFERARSMENSAQKKRALDKLLGKLPNMRFFDPSCGCGNFLVLAYRELRTLEMDAVKEMSDCRGVGGGGLAPIAG